MSCPSRGRITAAIVRRTRNALSQVSELGSAGGCSVRASVVADLPQPRRDDNLADPDVAMRHVLRSLARRWLDLHEEIKTHTRRLKARLPPPPRLSWWSPLALARTSPASEPAVVDLGELGQSLGLGPSVARRAHVADHRTPRRFRDGPLAPRRRAWRVHRGGAAQRPPARTGARVDPPGPRPAARHAPRPARPRPHLSCDGWRQVLRDAGFIAVELGPAVDTFGGAPGETNARRFEVFGYPFLARKPQ